MNYQVRLYFVQSFWDLPRNCVKYTSELFTCRLENGSVYPSAPVTTGQGLPHGLLTTVYFRVCTCDHVKTVLNSILAFLPEKSQGRKQEIRARAEVQY